MRCSHLDRQLHWLSKREHTHLIRIYDSGFLKMKILVVFKWLENGFCLERTLR